MSERKKRERMNTNNPLSAARQQHQTVSKSKKEIELGNIWHRKSGAGFTLFASYYGGQPPGVVAMSVKETVNQSVSDQRKRGPPVVRGAGQSRAAKRRKKKRGKGSLGNNNVGDTNPAAMDHNLDDTVGELQSPSASPNRSLESFSDKYTQLKPYFSALSKPLPLTFRIRSHCKSEIHRELQESLNMHSELVAPAPFESTSRIYQAKSSTLSKSTLSRLSPSLKEILVENSTNGSLARQELGSMLPVLALSGGGWLQRGDRVLDMCASPGSKTLHALEVVAAIADDESGSKSSKRGRVVANDVHPTRLESLQDAVMRSGLPSSVTSCVTFTNYDASAFPVPNSGKLFDTIIADVPCSGDGTIRKDKHILPMWTPATGNALHGLQVRILLRALELVKVGGVVCYSTCSLNPVEDEAVVAAALMEVEAGDTKEAPAIEIVEWPSHVLPGLVRRKGISRWKVADYIGEKEVDSCGNDDEEDDDVVALRWHKTHSDAVYAGMAHAKKTLWPPRTSDPENNNGLRLDLCSRLWPQDQDTGGFFVALLRKNQELRPCI